MIRTIASPLAAFAAALSALFAVPAAAVDVARDDVREFVDNLAARHGFDADYLREVLGQGERQQKILDAISRPAEKTKPWHEYRAIFLTDRRIGAGRAFRGHHDARLGRIAGETGVPAEIIAAIVGVETFYGQITGGYRVIDALATLGFDYPPRARFFRGELEQLFLLAREEDIDITGMEGSYAGAMGPPQFIPSSYRSYAVDGDGDGRRDLFDSWDDILASVANYFVAHDWRAGEEIAVPATPADSATLPDHGNTLNLTETVGSLRASGLRFETDMPDAAPAQLYRLEGETGDEYWVGFHNFRVITRYNRSVMYALAVAQLAAELETDPARQARTTPES